MADKYNVDFGKKISELRLFLGLTRSLCKLAKGLDVKPEELVKGLE